MAGAWCLRGDERGPQRVRRANWEFTVSVTLCGMRNSGRAKEFR